MLLCLLYKTKRNQKGCSWWKWNTKQCKFEREKKQRKIKKQSEQKLFMPNTCLTPNKHPRITFGSWFLNPSGNFLVSCSTGWMRRVMVGVQDWIQQCYVFDLVLVRGKGKEKETKRNWRKTVVQYSEMHRSVHLFCKLIYRALRIGFTQMVGKLIFHNFFSMQRINQF